MTRSVQSKREREKLVVGDMIKLYCKKNHGTKSTLCNECIAIYDYAIHKSNNCPFMENKTFCSNCKVHCYKPEVREKIREIMRFSGPRMLFVHPITAIKHVISTKQEKKRLQKLKNNSH